MSRFTLAPDGEIQARASRIEALLRAVCDDDERPWFVSNDASLYDVCSLETDEIVRRVKTHYGTTLQASDVGLPIWQLVDRLEVEK